MSHPDTTLSGLFPNLRSKTVSYAPKTKTKNPRVFIFGKFWTETVSYAVKTKNRKLELLFVSEYFRYRTLRYENQET